MMPNSKVICHGELPNHGRGKAPKFSIRDWQRRRAAAGRPLTTNIPPMRKDQK